jgi:hypothetical protein
VLGKAVQENLVSFPAQTPVFERTIAASPATGDRDPVLCAGMDDIAERYSLGRQRIGQILTAWRIRTVREAM